MSGRIPKPLQAALAAMLATIGAGGGVYLGEQERTSQLQTEYLQTVAADTSTSDAIKLAMVLGSYYESSFRHIGTPYVDKLGRGQPLTVCNGLTGADVVAGRSYSPADCYRLERVRYLGHERWLASDVPRWSDLPLFVQVTVLDFLHNKGASAFASSTMRRKLVAGNLEGACLENPRWNRGTVGGVSTVLPGLEVRGKSNAEICLWDAPPAPLRPPVVTAPEPEVPPEPPPAPPHHARGGNASLE